MNRSRLFRSTHCYDVKLQVSYSPLVHYHSIHTCCIECIGVLVCHGFTIQLGVPIHLVFFSTGPGSRNFLPASIQTYRVISIAQNSKRGLLCWLAGRERNAIKVASFQSRCFYLTKHSRSVGWESSPGRRLAIALQAEVVFFRHLRCGLTFLG